MAASLFLSERARQREQALAEPVQPPPAGATADDVAAYDRRLVSAAFLAENLTRQAGRNPAELSLSGVGGCTRRAAYSVAGTEPSDIPPPQEARAAVLGTWLHDNLLPRMAHAAGPGTAIEHPVTLRAAGLLLPGTLDLAQSTRRGAPLDRVLEAKSVAEFAMQGVRRLDGAYTAHWLQAMSYALARHQGGDPVSWVTFLYMNRASGQVHVEVDSFTNFAMLTVVDRVHEIVYWAQQPDQAPRAVATVGGRRREYALLRGPGLSPACDWCPFLRRCWGPDARPAEPGAQKTLAATPAGVEQALELYARAGELESQARRDKEFVRLVVADIPDGVYGRWTLKHGRPGQQLDQDTVRADYAARGLEPPMMPKAGGTYVRPTPQED